MAKRFDIYLGNRTTHGDIFIYSLPFLRALKVESSMILDEQVETAWVRRTASIRNDGESAVELESRASNGSVFRYAGAESAIEIRSSSDGYVSKHSDANSAMEMLSSAVDAAISQEINPAESNMALDTSEVETSVRRYRALGEMDPNALSVYDGMTLDNVDYIMP